MDFIKQMKSSLRKKFRKNKKKTEVEVPKWVLFIKFDLQQFDCPQEGRQSGWLRAGGGDRVQDFSGTLRVLQGKVHWFSSGF